MRKFSILESLVKYAKLRSLGLKIAESFFGEHAPKLWLEGPYSPEGKAREVYSKELTPPDWKSFSEVHGLTLDQVDAPFLTEAQ